MTTSTYYDAALGRFVTKEPKKPRRVRVYLEDGSFVLVRKQWAKDVVGITEYNDIIANYQDPITKKNILIGLTNCCSMDAKGCDGYIGCRGCYRPVDSSLGGYLNEHDIYIRVKK